MAKELTIQIKEVLDEYSAELRDAVKEACEGVAKDTAKRLRDTSPKKTGDYAKGWSARKNKDADWTVYNRTDPGLTHLLEKGHAVKPRPTHPGKKDRVNGIPHIKPAEEWANEELQRRIEGSMP